MLMIRLQRTGRKHEPTFRIVLTDSKNSAKSGRIHEILGSYDPRNDAMGQMNEDRVKHWMSVGAKVSGTVHNMLVSKGVIGGKKINVLPKKTPIKKEGDAAASAPVAAASAPAAAEAPASTPAPEAAPEEAPTDAPADAASSTSAE